MSVVETVISGVGSYLPERVVTNHDLAKKIDTSDEWIRSRSGIGERHFAAEGELTSDLAVNAAWRALDQAGLEALARAQPTPSSQAPEYLPEEEEESEEALTAEEHAQAAE